jgi:hypothetical protein
MADTIIDGTAFNLNNIMYTSPKSSPQGGKSVNILNKTTKTGLRLSTPIMLTWGASDFVDEKTGVGNGKFEMSLQFPSQEYKTEDTDLFLKNMQAFQDKIKSDALIYSKEWFGKVHKSSEIIDELFSPMLKYPNFKGTREPDYNKQPALKIKIPLWEGSWKCEIYDEDGEKLFPSLKNQVITPLDYLKKGANIAVLIQFGGIWFVNGKFSISWKLIQAVVQKPKPSLTGQCFIKLKTVDKEKLKVSQVENDCNECNENISSVLVEDSDDENELYTEQEPTQVIEPPNEIIQLNIEPVVQEQTIQTDTKKKVVKRRS